MNSADCELLVAWKLGELAPQQAERVEQRIAAEADWRVNAESLEALELELFAAQTDKRLLREMAARDDAAFRPTDVQLEVATEPDRAFRDYVRRTAGGDLGGRDEIASCPYCRRMLRRWLAQGGAADHERTAALDWALENELGPTLDLLTKRIQAAVVAPASGVVYRYVPNYWVAAAGAAFGAAAAALVMVAIRSAPQDQPAPLAFSLEIAEQAPESSATAGHGYPVVMSGNSYHLGVNLPTAAKHGTLYLIDGRAVSKQADLERRDDALVGSKTTRFAAQPGFDLVTAVVDDAPLPAGLADKSLGLADQDLQRLQTLAAEGKVGEAAELVSQAIRRESPDFNGKVAVKVIRRQDPK